MRENSITERAGTNPEVWRGEEDSWLAWTYLSAQAVMVSLSKPEARASKLAERLGYRQGRRIDGDAATSDFLQWATVDSSRIDLTTPPDEALDNPFAWTMRVVASWIAERERDEARRNVGLDEEVVSGSLGPVAVGELPTEADADFEVDPGGALFDALVERGVIDAGTPRDFDSWRDALVEAVHWVTYGDWDTVDDAIEFLDLEDWLRDPEGEEVSEPKVNAVDPGVWDRGAGAYRRRRIAERVDASPSTVDLDGLDELSAALRGGDWRVCGPYRGGQSGKPGTGARRHRRAGEALCRGRFLISGSIVEDWADRGLSCQDLDNLQRLRECSECGLEFVPPKGGGRPPNSCGECRGVGRGVVAEAVGLFETESVRILKVNHPDIVPD